MSKNNYDDEIVDDDPTDELPILTDVMPPGSVAHTAPVSETPGDDDTGRFAVLGPPSGETDVPRDDRGEALQRDLDERDRRLAALETELSRLEQRWRSTDAALGQRDVEIEHLRTALEERRSALERAAQGADRAQAEIRARGQRVAALADELASARARADGLEQQARGLEQRIAELEAEAAAAGDRPAAGAPSPDALREEVAALSQHIENRNAIWREQAAALAEQTTRVRELELELAQRIERQTAAERRAEIDQARAATLSRKLRDAISALERVERARAAPAGSARPGAASLRPPERLREELARAIDLQARAGDDAQSLERFAELETAILALERQMDAADGDKPPAAAPRHVPRLVCLTGQAPETYVIDGPSVVIGRGTHCGIHIATHYVSREHARISNVGDRCEIEDLQSRNGVFVNSVRVERRILADNDLVTIGDTQFRFLSGARAES